MEPGCSGDGSKQLHSHGKQWISSFCFACTCSFGFTYWIASIIPWVVLLYPPCCSPGAAGSSRSCSGKDCVELNHDRSSYARFFPIMLTPKGGYSCLYWACWADSFFPYLQMTLWSEWWKKESSVYTKHIIMACCPLHAVQVSSSEAQHHILKSGLNAANMKLLSKLCNFCILTPFAWVGGRSKESPPPTSCFLSRIWCFHHHFSQIFCLSLSQSFCIMKIPCIKKVCWGFLAKSALKRTSLSILLCTKENIDFPAVSKALLYDMRMKQILSLTAAYYKWNCCEQWEKLELEMSLRCFWLPNCANLWYLVVR